MFVSNVSLTQPEQEFRHKLKHSKEYQRDIECGRLKAIKILKFKLTGLNPLS